MSPIGALLLFLSTSLVYADGQPAQDWQLSSWSPWSDCFGNCTVARSVRNRNVLVPSLASNSKCLPLFQIAPCRPLHCSSINTSDAMPTPGPLLDFLHSPHLHKVDKKRLKPLGETGSIATSLRVESPRIVLAGSQPNESERVSETETQRAKQLARTANHHNTITSVAESISTKRSNLENSSNQQGDHNIVTNDIVDADLNYDKASTVADIDTVTISTSASLSPIGDDLSNDTRPSQVDEQSTSETIVTSTLSSPVINEDIQESPKEKHSKEVIVMTTNTKQVTTATPIDNENTIITSTTSKTTVETLPRHHYGRHSSQRKQETPKEPEYYINSLTIDIPMKPKITPSVENNLKKRLNISQIRYRNFGEPPYVITTSTESPMNDVLRQLESAADLDIPLDDKHIRKALRKNRKLMKALVEAYKYRKSSGSPESLEKSSESSSTTTTSTSPSSFVTELATELMRTADVTDKTTNQTTESEQKATSEPSTTIDESTENAQETLTTAQTTLSDQTSTNGRTTTTTPATAESSEQTTSTQRTTSTTESAATEQTSEVSSTTTTEATTTTTSPPYWPKHGYVPNTRKHASDITSKLYMTHEIIQALNEDPIRRFPILRVDCLENRRCCKVERDVCSDGGRPTPVRRFYRPPGSSSCDVYWYPRCSQLEEIEEQPIQFEQNCQDLCFSGPEKRISPLLRMDD